MREHFTRGVHMRDAVIQGNLEALRLDAQWLAEHELSADLPEAWRPHVRRLQDAAKKALDARDPTTAAAAVAETAGACGACHVALGGPDIALGAPPAEGSGAALHMAQHQWAAARMWDALTAPSEETWRAATEVMADAPLAPEVVTGARSVPEIVGQLARQVHDTAESARLERGLESWVRSYGRVLATCAGCHGALGQGPRVGQR